VLRLLMERLDSPAADRVTDAIKPLIVVKEFKMLGLKQGSANLTHDWKKIVTHIAKEVLDKSPPPLFFVAFQLSDFCYTESSFNERELQRERAKHERKLVEMLMEAGAGKKMQRKIDLLKSKADGLEEKLDNLKKKEQIAMDKEDYRQAEKLAADQLQKEDALEKLQEEITVQEERLEDEVRDGNELLFQLLEVVRKEIVRVYNTSVVATGAEDFGFLLTELFNMFQNTIGPFAETAVMVCHQYLKISSTEDLDSSLLDALDDDAPDN